MGLDGTTNKQFSVSRETERPKHAQTSRQTDPGLTRGGRIGSTAAVAAVGACTPGELIIGFIAKELVSTGSTIDLIRTPAPVHEVIADFSECPIIARAT
jgi:hypothetical protein